MEMELVLTAEQIPHAEGPWGTEVRIDGKIRWVHKGSCKFTWWATPKESEYLWWSNPDGSSEVHKIIRVESQEIYGEECRVYTCEEKVSD